MAPSGKPGLDLRPGPFLKVAANRLDVASRRGFPVTVAWLLSGLFFIGFLAIAEDIVEPISLAMDRAATALLAVVAGPVMTQVMWAATLVADTRVAVVTTLVIAILLAVWGHPRRAGSVVVLMLVSSGLAQVVKLLVERPRPPAAAALIALPVSASFPSGHAMAGIVPPDASPAAVHATYIANLKSAAAELARHGIALLIEAINTRDMPGFYLNTQAQAHAVLEEVGAPNLRMQMDCYHMQIMEGDLAMKLRKYAAHCAHVQVAGVPQRHEPDTGEVCYSYVFDLLDEIGYSGWVGCEYRPAGKTIDGLGWFQGHSARMVV